MYRGEKMTPDNPPRLNPYWDFDCEYIDLDEKQHQELKDSVNLANFEQKTRNYYGNVHINYYEAIDREEYFLKRLTKCHSDLEVEAIIRDMRDSR
jgi:hypothetical protein